MFIRSFKLTKRKIVVTAVVLAAAVVTAGYCLGKGLASDRTQHSTEKTAQTTVQTLGKPKTVSAKNREEQMEFAAQYGWELSEEPLEVVEVVIPEEFDETFTKYNQIQADQGMDLTKLQGKRVKRYTYKITNYPGCPQDARLNLLIYKDKIVGGDVCSVALDGFMHGFAAPAGSSM